MEKLKNNRKIIAIIGILLLAIIGLVLYFSSFNNAEKENDKETDKIGDVSENNKEDEKEELNVPEAPATNTENLVDTMKKVEVSKMDNDKIEFTQEVKVEEGEKIAVWVYSTPKFLGYFEVIVKNGVKMIEGLAEALSNITVEKGNHNIALVTENGKEVGYIDVYIEDDGKITEKEEEKEYIVTFDSNGGTNVSSKKVKENEKVSKPTNPTRNGYTFKEWSLNGKKYDFNKEVTSDITLKAVWKQNKVEEKPKEEEKKPVVTTKEEVVNEVVKFKITNEDEVNMKKGTTKIVQEGSDGTKEITYKVTYEDDKEVSRTKISEKVTKEAVNKIVKVGMSDFNINTDKKQGSMGGLMCTKDQTIITKEGLTYCNDFLEDLKEFMSVNINGIDYVYSIDNKKVTPIKLINEGNDTVFCATYNGTLYYFDGRMGEGEPLPLTKELCNNYNLSCGEW